MPRVTVIARRRKGKFILDAKFSIATPMYWSNIVSGGYLMVLALAGLATVRRAAR